MSRAPHDGPQERLAEESHRQPVRIGGWREVTAFVSDLVHWTGAYPDAMGWRVESQGAATREELDFWGFGREASAAVAVLENPGADRGRLRLVQAHGVTQTRIRPDVSPWHTGGLFDANARVRDIAAVTASLTRLGWRGLTPPTRFAFGPFTVQEVLMEGPDGVVLALIEREAPPLEGWPHLRTASRLFNSTQTVRSLDRAMDFYRGTLGFQTYLEHDGASDPPGANVLGLDPETAQSVVRRVRIVHPEGTNDGSVELIEFVDHPGDAFPISVRPPGLGLAALSFPCADVDGLAARLREGEHEVFGPVDLDGTPTLATHSPEGARLEFYEPPPARESR